MKPLEKFQLKERYIGKDLDDVFITSVIRNNDYMKYWKY